jgi:hypothetical protein
VCPPGQAPGGRLRTIYQAAPAATEQGVHTVPIDAMTGIQALERAARILPMQPGHVERREFEYVRHGTQVLIAAFDVATGKVRGSVGDSRTEMDDVAFLQGLLATAGPAASWQVICDNRNTHLSEGVVRPRLRTSTPRRKKRPRFAGAQAASGLPVLVHLNGLARVRLK